MIPKGVVKIILYVFDQHSTRTIKKRSKNGDFEKISAFLPKIWKHLKIFLINRKLHLKINSGQ